MQSSEKVLVTGAAGFIGSHLVDALVSKGEKVFCLVREQDNLEFLPKGKVHLIVGDITRKETFAKVIANVDTIYHLAAKTDFEGKSWEEYYKPNVLGTKNLLDLAVSNKVKRFVFFSSIRVVGLQDSKKPVNEVAGYNPLNFYDKSKVEAEEKVLEAYRKYKLPVVILRPTSVYGPRNCGTYYSFFKAIAQKRFFLVGDGHNLVSFVFVKNVVDAALLAGFKKEAIGQIYFINDEHPYTMEYLARTIADAFGYSLPSFKLPRLLGYLAGYGLEFLGNTFGFNPPLTSERVKNLTINYVFDISKARKELGYNPRVTLPQGVKETVAWYKKYGWI